MSAGPPLDSGMPSFAPMSDDSAALPSADRPSPVVAFATPSASSTASTGSLRPTASSTPSSSSPPSSPTVAVAFEPQLLEETKRQIRTIVNEIARLSQSELPVNQFFDEFLSRVVAALAAVGGAVWTCDENGRLTLQHQINLGETGILSDDDRRTMHTLLIRRAVRDMQATLVPPHCRAFDSEDAGNPTEHLLLLAPLPIEGRVEAVIEVFQRAGGGPTTQRGYLRFVVQMAELAIDYLKNHRLRRYSDRESQWDQLERFALTIHRGLDVTAAAYRVVNDGRRIVECDRLSMAVRRGRKMRLAAVSGLDSLDRRGREVAALERLVDVATRTGEVQWLVPGDDDIPPQLEGPLDEFADASHSRLVGVLPLFASPATVDGSDADDPDGRAAPVRRMTSGERTSRTVSSARPVIGALVVEQFLESEPASALVSRASIVASHAGVALANGMSHERLVPAPLRGWLRSNDPSRIGHETGVLSRVLWSSVAAAVVFAALALIPARLELPADGQLVPSSRHGVYAQVNGVIVDVPVAHGDAVERGDVLARMRNTDVEIELIRLQGAAVMNEQRQRANEQQRLRSMSLSAAEQDRLNLESIELRQEAASIAEQLSLIRQRARRLTVIADAPGEVATWQVGVQLLRRPVREGELLMEIVDPDKPWELDLAASERHVGGIRRAMAASPEGLPVRFVAASHPDREFTGRLVDVHEVAQRGSGSDPAQVRLRVELDAKPDVEQAGVSVSAKIDCGRCSLGYSWFHDLIDAARGKLLFWLS